jgi:hypothetical protein
MFQKMSKNFEFLVNVSANILWRLRKSPFIAA